MEQEFFILEGAILPVLRMELINDGRYSYDKFYKAIQNAEVTFSMRNVDTGILKISNAKCEILEVEDSGCEEKYIIQYTWKKRDTNEKGKFQGIFNINFLGGLKESDLTYSEGLLKTPIASDLVIYIK